VGPRVVFIVDEAQELKPAVLETIRGLWDRGEHARQGYVTKSAFGWVPVGNEMFMGKGGNLRVARFRPLMPRLTASVHLPRPDKKEIAALARSRGTCGHWALRRANRGLRLAAKGKPVALDLLRRNIRLMGGGQVMTELFKIEIVLESQHLLDFGDFVNAVCLEFPGCVEWQTEALIEACSADNLDIPAILLALSTLATYAHNAVMVDDAVAQSIGRASPVHLKGGPVQ
jgi:hypothetical protein